MTDLSSLSDEDLQALLQTMNTVQGQQEGAQLTHTSQPLMPTFPFDPTEGMNAGEKLAAGMGRGMTNVVRHVGNWVGLESDQALKEAAKRDAPLLNTRGGETGSLLGETAALTPLTLGASGAVGATGVGARMLANPLVRGAAEGAFQGGLMADPGQKGLGVLTGGATGIALPAISKGAQRLVYGLERTPEAQQLINQGVRLTPGQMNPEGVWNKIEENVRGVPVIGNVVEHARGQAEQDFRRGVIEEAAAPGHTLQSTSHDPNVLFQEAQDSYKPLYDAAKGFPVTPEIHNLGANIKLADALDAAAQKRTVGATRASRDQASDFLAGQLEATLDKAKASGGLLSDHLIELRSNINEEIRDAGQDNAGKAYAKLLRGARDRVTDSINSQIPPDAASALQTANDAYPKLAIIRDAIKRGGDQAHGFTPAQLSAAVKQASENNEYARGGGLMRDWSSAGRDIFTERNPRTGASHGTTGALMGGAYALHHFLPGAQIPAALGAAGALGMIGTQTGRNILAGQTAPQRATQRLIEGLERATTPGQRQIAGTAARAALNRGVVPAVSGPLADKGNP